MRIDKFRLGLAMAKCNLNFKQLSERCGVSRTTLSYINNGKTCKPDIAYKIATALNIEVTDLLEEN